MGETKMILNIVALFQLRKGKHSQMPTVLFSWRQVRKLHTMLSKLSSTQQKRFTRKSNLVRLTFLTRVTALKLEWQQADKFQVWQTKETAGNLDVARFSFL